MKNYTLIAKVLIWIGSCFVRQVKEKYEWYFQSMSGEEKPMWEEIDNSDYWDSLLQFVFQSFEFDNDDLHRFFPIENREKCSNLLIRRLFSYNWNKKQLHNLVQYLNNSVQKKIFVVFNRIFSTYRRRLFFWSTIVITVIDLIIRLGHNIHIWKIFPANGIIFSLKNLLVK